MSLFVVDVTRDTDLLKEQTVQIFNVTKTFRKKLLKAAIKDGIHNPVENYPDINEENDEDDITEADLFGLPPPEVDISDIIDATLEITDKKPIKIEEEMDSYRERLQELFKKTQETKPKLKYLIDLDSSTAEELLKPTAGESLIKTDVDKIMATTNLLPGLEKLESLPSLSKKKQRELNRIERRKTKGKDWFNMPAPEITKEVENDLKILQMRSVLDPKHFYKKNDLKVLPKYFQIGTVQHSPLDYYSERDMRRNRKRSILDELLSDNATQQYAKRKYKEIMEQKIKYAHRKNMKKMKKLKKNK